MFKLVIEDDEGNKTVVPIIRDEITIGRKDGNTIRLTERNVSRTHARLVRDDGSVFLEEVSARYGTRKNGDRIDGRTEFGVGDVFTIGDYRLTLQSEVAPEANKPKKPNGATPPLPREFSNQPTQITSLEEATDAPREGTEIIAADPAKLVIVSSNFAGQEFPLARKEMVIGRGEECDIIIDHRSVSQKHAKIVREQGGEYKIIDLKSKNGVKVGGEEYRAVHLKRGDIVELGHVKFRFVEPGENYVFTPQTSEEEFAAPAGSKSVLALVIVLIVALAVVGGVLMFGGSSEEATVVTDVKVDQEPTAPVAVADPEPEPEIDSGIDELIEEAMQEFLAGKATEAVVMLELVKKREELSGEQVERVDSLLSKARLEKSFERHFHNGRDAFKKEQWLTALQHFHNIPPNEESNIYQLMEEENYKQRAIDNLFEEAIALANDGEENKDFDSARTGPEVVLELFPDDEQALAVLDQIEDKRDKKVRRPVAAVRKVNKPKATRNEKPTVPEPAKPVKAAVSSEDLYRQAIQANLKGNPQAAIDLANEALRHGCGNKCKRVLAVAYKNQGDDKNACRYYREAGVDIPSGLNCE